MAKAEAASPKTFVPPIERGWGIRGKLWPSRDELVATGRPALAAWGMLSVLFQITLFFSPDSVIYYARFLNWFNAFAWAVFAFIATRKTFRLCFPIVVLLIVQVWSVATQVTAATLYGRPQMFGQHVYFSVQIAVTFFLVYGVCVVVPQARRYLANQFLGFCLVSAVFSLFQFAKIGPFVQLSRFWQVQGVENWSNILSVRPVGLTTHAITNAYTMTVAMGLLCSKWLYRKMRPLDYAAFSLLAVSAVMAQARSILPAVAFAVIVGLRMAYKSDRRAFFVSMSMLIVFAVAVFVLMADRFGYLFQANWFRPGGSGAGRLVRWEHAAEIYRNFPLTGIGPDESLFSMGMQVDKWSGRLMESSYLAFLAMFGIPGLAMLVLGYLGSFVLSWRLYATLPNDSPRKGLALAAIVAVAALALHSTGTISFIAYSVVPIAMLIAGMLAPTEDEVRPKVRVLALK